MVSERLTGLPGEVPGVDLLHLMVTVSSSLSSTGVFFTGKARR